MADCDRCGRPLEERRLRGHCDPCRRLCPRCGQPNGRKSSSGYCAACQRKRRHDNPLPAPPPNRSGQRVTLEPGLRNGQAWFRNPTPEQRLPIQHITLDVERTVRVLKTFYTPDEFRVLVDLCRRHVEIGKNGSDGSDTPPFTGRKHK